MLSCIDNVQYTINQINCSVIRRYPQQASKTSDLPSIVELNRVNIYLSPSRFQQEFTQLFNLREERFMPCIKGVNGADIRFFSHLLLKFGRDSQVFRANNVSLWQIEESFRQCDGFHQRLDGLRFKLCKKGINIAFCIIIKERRRNCFRNQRQNAFIKERLRNGPFRPQFLALFAQNSYRLAVLREDGADINEFFKQLWCKRRSERDSRAPMLWPTRVTLP